ncbi:MAG: RecX family transcriptional regulator [Candidatus Gracilibacteria bacterium]
MEISQRIIDYSIWYYLKYYPSPKKLEQKLIFKFGPNSKKGKKYGGIGEEEIRYIIDEKLRNILQEEEVIKSKIRVYKSKGKSKLYIKQKLFGRQERKELSELFLEEAFIDGEFENIKKEYEKLKNKYNREKIIEKMMRKGFFYNDILKVIN